MKILLVDDHEIVRQAVGHMLEKQGMQVIGSAANGREALRKAAELHPDTVITETHMPDLSGIETATQILAQAPDTRIIALTAHAEAQTVTNALKAHFSGYVLKKCSFGQLVDAIKAVHSGQMYLCPEVVGSVVSNHVHETEESASSTQGNGENSRLSAREREVLQLVAEGNSTKEIADRLSISLKTVETHRRRVMSKLKLFSVAELTKYAIREGLTRL